MRIDDLSAFIQAHKLVSGRSCPEFVPSDLGVGCAYFNALQTARRIHSENAGGYIPLYAKSKYGLCRSWRKTWRAYAQTVRQYLQLRDEKQKQLHHIASGSRSSLFQAHSETVQGWRSCER